MEMIFTENEIIEIIANHLNINPKLIKKESFQNNGFATLIDGGVSLYSAQSLKIICKVKTVDLYKKIGLKIDADKRKGIFDLWIDAPHRVRNNFKREAQIYEGIDSELKEHLPMYYGSYYDEYRSLVLMEYVENDVSADISDAERGINFLNSLHEFYYENEEKCKSVGAYIQTADDFQRSKKIYHNLIDCINSHYTTLSKEYFYDVNMFVNSIESISQEIIYYGRTLCHGDFCHANMKKKNEDLKIFDWEASGYFNPEFDVMNFLIRSPQKPNDDYITYVLSEYYRKSTIRNNKTDYQKCLLINLHLHFLYGLSWILPLFIEVENKDFIWFEMEKLIYLYNFLKNKNLDHLI